MISMVIGYFKNFILSSASLTGSRRLSIRALRQVAHANTKYYYKYDSNSIIDVFTKDLEVIDDYLIMLISE